MKKDYTYSAFISYSHEDEKVAKLLWKKLERYRLPAVLQKQYEDIPEKMHVFLDQGDIVPGDTVEKALCRELADSKKLIVVCSPNSAKSPYVELEVKNFISLGHSANDIIPYIIDGDVDRTSSNNCYVPSLFGETGKDTINGVSIVRDGKWKAFVGVLANLLDVKFDEIYKREKVRKNRITAVWSALGTLAACFIGFVIWYVTPHTKYYVDYITKWGIPVGIFELSKNDAKNELEHYEITTQFGRPQKLVHADNHFKPINQTHYMNFFNRPKIATYEYKNGFLPFIPIKNWKLSSAYYTINSGDFLDGDKDYTLLLEYNDDSENDNQVIVDFYYGKGTRERKSLSNNYLDGSCFFYSDVKTLILNNAQSNKDIYTPDIYFLTDVSTIYQFRISYDKEGFDTTVSFYNYNGLEASDKNSIKGITKQFDSTGRIESQNFIYDSPDITLPKSISYKYSLNGHLYSLAFMALSETNDEYINNSNVNYAFYEYEFLDNKEILFFFDSAKKPIDCKFFNGYKAESVICDDAKTEIKTWRKELEELYPNADVYEKLISKVDDNKTEFTTYWVINNKETKQNYMSEQKIDASKKEFYSIDAADNSFSWIEEINYIDGIKTETTYIPSVNSENIFLQSKTFDAHDRLISEKQNLKDGGILECSIEYKGDNRSISFLKNGKPYLNPSTKYSQANFVYNNNNQLISCDFKDDTNAFITSYLNFSNYEAKYNINGLKVSEKYLTPDSNLVLSLLGYAQYIADESFDHKYLTYYSYMDESGKYAKPLQKPYTHMVTNINSNERQMSFYIFDTIKRTDFYVDDVFYQRALFGENANSLFAYYMDETGRFSGSLTYNKAGFLVKKRIIEYTDNAQIIKNYAVPDFNVIDNEMINYFDGSQDYKKYYPSNTLRFVMKKNPDGKIVSVEEYLENGQKKLISTYTYNADESFAINTHDYTDDTDSTEYKDKNNNYINGADGYSALSYGFDNKNIKRKVVLKADGNGKLTSISSLSGKIIIVIDVLQDSPTEKFGIEKNDLILEWGDYKYFPTGSESELSENVEAGKIKAQTLLLYRPVTSTFYTVNFEAGMKGLGFNTTYAAGSIEESEQYINDLQTAYLKWLKKHQ